MSAESIAELLVSAVEIYLLLGSGFAVVFVLFLVGRLDSSAKGASPGFRLVIVPGVVLLWPLLCVRLIRKQGVPVECTYLINGETPSVMQYTALGLVTVGIVVSNIGKFIPRGGSENAESAVAAA